MEKKEKGRNGKRKRKRETGKKESRKLEENIAG